MRKQWYLCDTLVVETVLCLLWSCSKNKINVRKSKRSLVDLAIIYILTYFIVYRLSTEFWKFYFGGFVFSKFLSYTYDIGFHVPRCKIWKKNNNGVLKKLEQGNWIRSSFNLISLIKSIFHSIGRYPPTSFQNSIVNTLNWFLITLITTSVLMNYYINRSLYVDHPFYLIYSFNLYDTIYFLYVHHSTGPLNWVRSISRRKFN